MENLVALIGGLWIVIYYIAKRNCSPEWMPDKSFGNLVGIIFGILVIVGAISKL